MGYWARPHAYEQELAPTNLGYGRPFEDEIGPAKIAGGVIRKEPRPRDDEHVRADQEPERFDQVKKFSRHSNK